MNHWSTRTRKFATATLALADVKETGKHLGVTINDMVLAISAGALRQLLAEVRRAGRSSAVGFCPSEFRLLPRSHLGQLLHRRDDDAAGRDSTIRSSGCRPCTTPRWSAKETHHLMGPELVSRWSAYFPPAPAESAVPLAGRARTARTRCSTCRSPTCRARASTAGSAARWSPRSTRSGPLTTGSGLNITVWSYVDQLNISVLSDGATLADPHELTDAMIEAFVEIRRAAGLSEELTVVETAMAQLATGFFALGLHPVQEVLDRVRRCSARAVSRRSRMRAGRAGSRRRPPVSSTPPRSASANARPSCTGMIESSVPCSTKNGGASARTLVIGDASRYTCAVLGERAS